MLIADDVGLGKTLEAGLVASELVLRGKTKRILVVTTRAMLGQFQKEFWTRFSIPLARLDGVAIRRMRNQFPIHYNVFDQFERVRQNHKTMGRLDILRGGKGRGFFSSTSGKVTEETINAYIDNHIDVHKSQNVNNLAID